MFRQAACAPLNRALQVFGKLGDTGVQKLETSANDFERNKLDNFFFKASPPLCRHTCPEGPLSLASTL